MKLQCPHCGVKGSAEDSYSGRKVKCPKCQGLFEIKPDMALEIPEEPTLLSALSPTPTESPLPLSEVEIPISTDENSGDTGVDGALTTKEAEELAEIDEDIAEPETKTVPPAEQEESLDWEDVASEIDLQLTGGGTGEEHDDTLEDSPADISSLQDEFETPAGDFGLTLEEESGIADESDADIWDEVEEDPAESEVAGPMEESPSLDPDDSLSPEQELENDLLEPVASADHASFQNESETLSDDLGFTLEEESGIGEESDADIWDDVEEDPAESEVTEFMEESSLLDPVDSPSLEQEIENDLEETAPTGEPEEALGTNLNQDETLEAQELSAGGSGLSDDVINESDNKSYKGNAIRKAWAKIKAIWR